MSNRHDEFQTTHWSVVLAIKENASEQSREALEQLCQVYWPPLFSYVRRRGFDLAEAQDITQEFFTMLLSKDFLKGIDQQHGRFRAFLLASIKNFLANWYHAAKAKKRGGQHTILSLDFEQAERNYNNEPFHEVTPEQLFEQQWAKTVIAQALNALYEQYVQLEKQELFNALKPFLVGEKDKSYQETANDLDMSEGAVKVAVHRLRQQYGQQLRTEIRNGLSETMDVDEEIRTLFQAVRMES